MPGARAGGARAIPAVTLSTLLLQLTSWAILLLALRGLTRAGAAVTWSESLAAFSFARVVSFIPVTPGGLGTVDAALTALLTGFGASSSQALAATWSGALDRSSHRCCLVP